MANSETAPAEKLKIAIRALRKIHKEYCVVKFNCAVDAKKALKKLGVEP